MSCMIVVRLLRAIILKAAQHNAEQSGQARHQYLPNVEIYMGTVDGLGSGTCCKNEA